MKTDDLIAALVADNGRRVVPFGLRLALAVLAGAGIAGLIYLSEMGVREDLDSALFDPRFLLKIGVVLLLFITAVRMAVEVVRPTWTLDLNFLVLFAAPALLAVTVLGELVVLPPAAWRGELVGTNARLCVFYIPLLALAPLVMVLYAMRSGAPSNPRIAGVVAGLVAGSIGAVLYATHCEDDSPLFVATWYSLAIAFVVVLGGSVGARVLKW